MRNPRYGIIGTGRMAEKFVMTFQKGLVTEAELTGVSSDGGGRAEAFARAHGLKRWYNSYGELVRDPEIDIVYIANINDRHFDCCEMCIEAGKHILCEKPMFLRADEAQKLIGLARDAGLFMMEAMWTRFTPAFGKAMEWVAQGRIGTLRNISATLCAARSPVDFPRLYDPGRFGGALYDLGIYGIQLAQYFARGLKMKDIHSVKISDPTGVDASTYLHLVYDGGLVGEIKCSIGWYACNEAWLCGDNGYIRIAPSFNFAQQVELYTQPFPAAGSLEPAKPADVYTKESPSGLEYEINHAASCVKNGLHESPIMPLNESLEIARIFEQVQNEKEKRVCL